MGITWLIKKYTKFPKRSDSDNIITSFSSLEQALNYSMMYNIEKDEFGNYKNQDRYYVARQVKN